MKRSVREAVLEISYKSVQTIQVVAALVVETLQSRGLDVTTGDDYCVKYIKIQDAAVAIELSTPHQLTVRKAYDYVSEVKFRRRRDGTFDTDKVSDYCVEVMSSDLADKANRVVWFDQFMKALDSQSFDIELTRYDADKVNRSFSSSYIKQEHFMELDNLIARKNGSIGLCGRWSEDADSSVDTEKFLLTVRLSTDNGVFTCSAWPRSSVTDALRNFAQELNEKINVDQYNIKTTPSSMDPSEVAEIVMARQRELAAKLEDLVQRITIKRDAEDKSKALVEKVKLSAIYSGTAMNYCSVTPLADETKVRVGVMMQTDVTEEQARNFILGLQGLVNSLGIQPSRASCRFPA